MAAIVYTVVTGVVPAIAAGQVGVNLADGLLFWLDADLEIQSKPFAAALDPAYIAPDDESVAFASDALVKSIAEAVVCAILGPDPSPANLSTLKQIAAAIGDDPAFAVTVASNLSEAISDAIGALHAVATSGSAADLTGTLNPERIADGALSYAKLASGASASTAQILGNTTDLLLTTDAMWASEDLVTIADGSPIALDMSTFRNATITLGAAATREVGAPTNTKPGQRGSIFFTQPAAGSKLLTFHANWKFAGGVNPTASTAGNSVDELEYIVMSSTFIRGVFRNGLAT